MNTFKKMMIAVFLILLIGLTGCAQLKSLTRHIFTRDDSAGSQHELAGSTLTVETNSAQAPAQVPETQVETAAETQAEDAEAETEAQTEAQTEAETEDAQTSDGEVTYTSTNEVVYTSTDLNARNAPGPDGEVAKTIPAGTKLTRIAIGSNGWDKVDFNGELYYMAHDYLTTTAP